MIPANRSIVLAAIALAMAAAGASAAPAVEGRTTGEWLEFMNRAFVERNYDGVFSYFDGTDLSTLRVVHSVVDGVQRERLVHLNGAPREIIRRGDDVTCVLQPGDEMLALQASIPSGPFARVFSRSLDGVTDNYELTLQGTDRIADRSTTVLELSPRDHDRYGYRLWLDEETGLLLRSELIDMAGARLEIFQFAHVTIDAPIAISALEPEHRDGAVTSHLTLAPSQQTRTPGKSRWHAAWVPSGFAMAAWDLRRTPATRAPVNTLMYSDGLAAFTVFIEDMPESGAATFVSRNGATVAVTHMTSGPGDRAFLVTVVGELPVDTAQRVARSIGYQ